MHDRQPHLIKAEAGIQRRDQGRQRLAEQPQHDRAVARCPPGLDRHAPDAAIDPEEAGLKDAPALTVAPEIAQALGALSACEGAGLVRMSGSGATVFALFEKVGEARAAAERIASGYPRWWVVPTILGG